MGLRPTQSDADTQVADLRIGIDAARIAGDIESGNTELTAGASDFHDRVENRRRLLDCGIITMSASFESDAVDGAIHFGNADDLSDLICKRCALLQVDDFATETLRLSQPLGNHIADDDNCSAKKVAGSRAGKTNRSGACNVHNGTGSDAGFHRAVEARRENVRQQRKILDLRHGFVLVGEFHQIEIRVRYQNIFGLTANPSAHIDVTISGAGTRRIYGQTNSGLAFTAIAATAAGDVEGDRTQVADIQHFDIDTLFNNFSRDLVSENQSLWGRGAASNHVLIGPADVGRHNFQYDAVRGVFPAERIGLARGHLQLRVIDRFHFDFSRAYVGNSTIARHTKSPLLRKMFQYRWK